MAVAPSDIATVERWRAKVECGELIAPYVLAAGADFVKVFSEVPVAHWRAILDEARAVGVSVCGHTPAEVKSVEAASAGQRSNEHLTQIYEACSASEEKWIAQRKTSTDVGERDVLESFDQAACNRTAAALAATGQVQVPALVLAYSEVDGARGAYREDERWHLLRADEQERWGRLLEEPVDIELARERFALS